MPYRVSRRAEHPGRPKGPLSVGLIWALLPFERRGTTTADLVRGNRPGTFNGTPAWSNGPRGPVISFGATTDYLSAGTAEFLPTTANFSIVLSWRKTDGTKRNSNPFGELAGVIAQRCQVHLPYSDGTVYFDYGGSTNGVTRVQAASLTFGDDIWVFTVGRRGMEIWQNGYLRASNTAQPTRTASSAGWNINKASSPGDLATTSGVLVYDRQLTPNEIATLTADISAPFRPARHRISAKAPASGAQTISLGRASSSETSRALTVSTALATALARASESDSARALTPALALAQAVGRAPETDESRTLTVSAAIAAALARASETDTARALTSSLAFSTAVGRASETDEARALTVAATLAVAIARATETDVSRELAAALASAIGVGRASESDEARGLVQPQDVAIGRASETGEARGLAVYQPSPEEPAVEPGSEASSGGVVDRSRTPSHDRGRGGFERVSANRNEIILEALREASRELSDSEGRSGPAPIGTGEGDDEAGSRNLLDSFFIPSDIFIQKESARNRIAAVPEKIAREPEINDDEEAMTVFMLLL